MELALWSQSGGTLNRAAASRRFPAAAAGRREPYTAADGDAGRARGGEFEWRPRRAGSRAACIQLGRGRACGKHAGKNHGPPSPSWPFQKRTEAISCGVTRRLGVWWLLLASLGTHNAPLSGRRWFPNSEGRRVNCPRCSNLGNGRESIPGNGFGAPRRVMMIACLQYSEAVETLGTGRRYDWCRLRGGRRTRILVCIAVPGCACFVYPQKLSTCRRYFQ